MATGVAEGVRHLCPLSPRGAAVGPLMAETMNPRKDAHPIKDLSKDSNKNALLIPNNCAFPVTEQASK